MSLPENEPRFRVAFSFPGEKRAYVEEAARLLADRFGEEAILYDRFHTADFARPNLGSYLPELYHKHASLVVVVLCAEYEEKEWCHLEWRAVLDLIKKRRDDDIMLFRADDADIPGFFSIDGSVPIDAFSAAEAATLILQRLALNEGRPRDFYLANNPGSPPRQLDATLLHRYFANLREQRKKGSLLEARSFQARPMTKPRGPFSQRNDAAGNETTHPLRVIARSG